MQKKLRGLGAFMLLLLLTVNLYSCGKEAPQKWEISLPVAEGSSENAYAITWTTAENIISRTGCFFIQNPNLFDMTVHLVTPGREEISFEVSAGGQFTQNQIEKDVPYQVGIHADKEEETLLEIMIYDGGSADSVSFNH